MSGSAPQSAKVDGNGNILVQAIGTGISVSVGAQPHLALIPVANRLKTDPVTKDLDLLDPFRRRTELLGRDPLLALLRR